MSDGVFAGRSYKTLLSLRVGAVAVAFVCGAFATSAIAGNTLFQYDSLGRVIKVIYPDNKQVCFAYDAAGNRTQVKRQATGTCTVPGSTLVASQTTSAMTAVVLNGDDQVLKAMAAVSGVELEGEPQPESAESVDGEVVSN